MAKILEFFFDYGSPFSYLADTQIAAVAARHGAALVYKPMLLGGVFKATGNSSPIAVPAKGKHMGVEIERWVRRYNIPMKMNPHFPFNTMPLMRGAVASQMRGNFGAYHVAAFRGVWVEELDFNESEVLSRILQKGGIDRAGIEDDEVKARLRANTDEAVGRGVFGAPTFFVGDEMFWGNDRLDFVEEALARS